MIYKEYMYIYKEGKQNTLGYQMVNTNMKGTSKARSDSFELGNIYGVRFAEVALCGPNNHLTQ